MIHGHYLGAEKRHAMYLSSVFDIKHRYGLSHVLASAEQGQARGEAGVTIHIQQ